MRHGETEWSKSGKHTGRTDLELTEEGREQARLAAEALADLQLRDPLVISSPRHRALVTAELAGLTVDEVTPLLAEWDYGDYEGLTTAQIHALRRQCGLDTARAWDIWRDGTLGEGGETAAELAARIDAVIAEIRALQGKAIVAAAPVADVLVVSHGHFLRAFAKRWLGYPLETPLVLILDPGGVGVLSYAHNNVCEPAFVLGGVFGVHQEGEDAEKGNASEILN